MAPHYRARNIFTNPIYKRWWAMKMRCDGKTNRSKFYKEKGIVICEEWLEFENFRRDMAYTYKEGLSLDRIDNNGNYEPSNCRWATFREQMENRSVANLVEFNGKRQTLSRWADELGVKRSTLAQRLYVYKWDISKTLTTPLLRKRG